MSLVKSVETSFTCYNMFKEKKTFRRSKDPQCLVDAYFPICNVLLASWRKPGTDTAECTSCVDMSNRLSSFLMYFTYHALVMPGVGDRIWKPIDQRLSFISMRRQDVVMTENEKKTVKSVSDVMKADGRYWWMRATGASLSFLSKWISKRNPVDEHWQHLRKDTTKSGKRACLCRALSRLSHVPRTIFLQKSKWVEIKYGSFFKWDVSLESVPIKTLFTLYKMLSTLLRHPEPSCQDQIKML